MAQSSVLYGIGLPSVLFKTYLFTISEMNVSFFPKMTNSAYDINYLNHRHLVKYSINGY